jgi:hypothetical protein
MWKLMAFRLRDGSEVQDRRLARLRQFDERSREFPVRSVISARKARSYTWACATHLDQGEEGACVGFSVAHELMARPCEVPGLDAKFATEKIYWAAQELDDWDGGSYPKATPKYDGTSVLAGVKAAKKLGYITEYRWAFSLQDLVLAVGFTGPAILGLNWYEEMFDIKSCGHLHVEGASSGGHAILCKGVNVDERYFVLHNSWGPKWGRAGDARISWQEMDRLLHEDGEAVVPTMRRLHPTASRVPARTAR